MHLLLLLHHCHARLCSFPVVVVVATCNCWNCVIAAEKAIENFETIICFGKRLSPSKVPVYLCVEQLFDPENQVLFVCCAQLKDLLGERSAKRNFQFLKQISARISNKIFLLYLFLGYGKEHGSAKRSIKQEDSEL